MKKLIYLSAAVAALFAFSSCTKENISPAPEVEGKTVNIRFSAANAGDTKTGVTYDDEGKKHTPYWNKGDEIGVIFDDFTDKSNVDAVLANANETGKTASFYAEGVSLNNDTEPGEAGKVYSFYPASAFQKETVKEEKTVKVNLKSTQTPAAVGTYDPEADILVGMPSDYLFDTSDNSFVADIPFARVMSVVKITLKAGNECPENLAVNKLTMTAPDGTILTGRVKLSLNTISGGYSPLSDWTVTNKEVSAIYGGEAKPVIGGEANTVYLIVNPTSIESGSDVIFTIDTDGYTIEKTVNLKGPLAFPQGNVANIGLTIAGANCTPKVAETRIWVESFENCTSENKKQYTISQTGAKGTGLNENTVYDYGTNSNTNIRFNSNGHSSNDPYLYVSADACFTASNLSVSEETSLQLSAQTKNAATITLKCKESAADDWTTIGTWTSNGSFGEKKTIFEISGTATSIDLSFTSTAEVIIDDIVLKKFVDERTILAIPANVKAEADANTSNKINVTWDAVANAGSYEITLSTAGQEDVIETSTTNSISFNSLAYSTEYSVKVKAISSDVELYKDSEYSAAVEVSTGAQPAVMIYFEKITSTDQIVDNEEYLIVHSTDAIFDGSRNKNNIDESNNYIAITESVVTEDGISYDTYKGYCVYIASMEGGYSFKTKGGVYFGRTSDSNGFNTSTTAAIASTLTFGEGGAVVIKGTGTSTKAFGYLSGKFRFYAASNAKDIYLYKKADPRTALATPEITVTADNAAKKITVSWNVVANAKDYTVTCTGQDAKIVALTTCAFTDLAYGEYTITVQANPADETNYKPSAKASKDVSIVDTTPVINAENPTAVEATATSVEVPYTVTNEVAGTNLTAAVTSGAWISNPQVTDEKVTFTLAANTASEQRTGTVTLSYSGAADKVITITQKGAGQTGYASLEDLVAAGEPMGANVTVTFSNKEIIDFYKSGQYTNGIWLSVVGAPDGKIEIYCKNVPAEWEVGGLVSGTLTDCVWKKYNDIWELCPSNWDDINYAGPVAKPEIALDGANATITCATAGATILYEISDTEPSNFTNTYSGAVALADGQTIWAKATLAGHPDSEVASKKYTAGGGTHEESFTIKSDDVVTNSSYAKYETTVDNRGWIITFGGNNKSVGTNSGNRSKCTLSSYSKYAVSPVTTSNIASAYACTTKLTGVKKISYTFNGGSNQTNTNVYVIYSSDGNTFSQISLTSGTQGATISSGTTYEFTPCDGYFALLFNATNSSGNWRIDDVNVTFTYDVTD